MIYLALILSVFVGAGLVFLVSLKPKQTKLLLAFSGAFLLAIVIFHLMPEVFSSTYHKKTIGVFIVIGLMLQMVLEFFSDGVEHGHVHSHKKGIPYLLLVSLFLHAFIEGIPIASHGISFLIGVVIHKLPIAIAITALLLESEISKNRIIIVLLLFAITAPLGNYLGTAVPFLINNEVYISAMVIGIMTHVSTTILYESSENHQFNLMKFSIVLLAFIIAYFI